MSNPIDSTRQRSDRLFVALLVTIALLVRTVAMIQFRRTLFFEGLLIDSAAYDAWAERIAGGDWIGREAFYQSPLYPYFLGCLYTLFGRSLLLARCVQILMGTASCVFIFLLARRLFGRSAAVWASLSAALYAPFIFQDIMILKSALIIFLVSGALLLLSRAAESGRRRAWWAGGFVFGLAAIERGQLLPVVPLLVLWSGLVSRPRRTAWTSVVFLVLGAGCAIGPVTLRNYLVSGDAVLTIASSGLNFYEGNHPTAAGIHLPAPEVRTTPEYEQDDARRFAEKALGRELTLSEVSGFYYRLAFRNIRRHPRFYFWLLRRKFALFWNDYEVPDNYNQYFLARLIPVLRWPLVPFGFLAPLGLLGAALALRRPRESWLLHLFILGYMVGILLFYVTSRYRLPVVVPLLVLAGHAVTRLVQLVIDRRWRPLAMHAAALAALWLAVHVTIFPREFQFAREHCFLGIARMSAGDLAGARDEFHRAIELDPDEPGILYNLAQLEIRLGEYEQARRNLERIPASAPNFDMAQRSLKRMAGLSHMPAAREHIRAGRYRRAREELEAEIRLHPDNLDARIKLGAVLISLGEYEAAVGSLRSAKERAPNHPGILRNIGVAREAQGLLEEAAESYRQSLAVEPSQPDLRKRLRAMGSGREGLLPESE